jgi:hypothetical protein
MREGDLDALVRAGCPSTIAKLVPHKASNDCGGENDGCWMIVSLNFNLLFL